MLSKIIPCGVVFWVVACLVPPAAAQRPAEKRVDEIVAAARPAVVALQGRDRNGNPVGVGCGFIVDPSGVIVTNFHLIEGAATVEVKLANGEVYDSAGVIDYDQRRDIALIKVKALHLPALKFADSDAVKEGQGVIVIGTVLGLKDFVSEGAISAAKLAEGTRYLEIAGDIAGLTDGAPLLDRNGAVIGTVTLRGPVEPEKDRLLAIPSNYIVPLVATEAKLTFPQLARKLQMEQAAQVEPQQPVRPKVPEYTLQHDHGSSFGRSCVGVLTISEGTVTFESENPNHSFAVPLEEIREAERNIYYGAEGKQQPFHIKLNSGKNYNFVLLNRDGYPIRPDAVLAALERARVMQRVPR